MNQLARLTIIFAFLIANTGILAQEPDPKLETKNIEENFDKNLSEVLHNWYLQSMIKDTSLTASRDTTIPIFPDSVYLKRIQNIPSAIELNYNNIVRNFIHVYSKKRRERVEIILGLSNYYFPIFERIFDQHELPHELKYLAIIESALNPRAVSRAGATGIWQFMYGTGRIYGLTINSFVDERRDPIKSTQAAAEYLKDLYNIFGEWDLAIAAYNCGPRNVSKAIYRAGGKKNFWDIYYYLPRETRGYFPAFIAATYIMNYHELHNIQPRPIDLPMVTDTIHINKKLHLNQVAQVLGIPQEQLEDLNPQYRKNIIPAVNTTFSLKIPLEKTKQFISMEDSIYNYKKEHFFEDKIIKNPRSTRYVHQAPRGKAKLYYRVKPGDNLGYIAEWYDVRASQLRYWNNIRGNLIRTNQKLVVYVPKNKVNYYKPVNSLSFEEKQKRIGQPVEKKNTAIKKSKPDDNYIYYKVKNGDTLWDIAKKYPGVSQTDLIKLNDLNNARNLKVGQYLKIKKKT
jgi:membrane-bound lytic murein transglycosylase D